MGWMDWWTLVGGILALVTAAAITEESIDYPDPVAASPVLRWGANVVIGALAVVLIPIMFYAVYLIWQVVVAIALVGGALWLLVWGVIRLGDWLGVGENSVKK